MTHPFNTEMKISWGWLPFTGLVCALVSMIATQMTENIWSAHTSMTGREIVEQMAVKVSEDFAKANESFVQMEATCQKVEAQYQEVQRLLLRKHWWQR